MLQQSQIKNIIIKDYLSKLSYLYYFVLNLCNSTTAFYLLKKKTGIIV